MIIIFLHLFIDPSYNQPKFASCATWNPNAITFANNNTIGIYPTGIFVNINNTVHVVAFLFNRVLVWLEGDSTPTRNLSGGLIYPYGIFATSNGDIYVDNGDTNHRVDKWSWNTTSSVAIMNTTSRCLSLFIDINDTLYCSNDLGNKVVKVSLNINSSTSSICAGNGTQGAGPYMLYYPSGIFVDTKFNLYVADCWNDRIQRFRPGQLNGTTMVDNRTSPSIILTRPIAVVLDADENLFIADYGNHRIVRYGSSGFKCLLGCTDVVGAASNQLNQPYALSFDSHGNIFVSDTGNSRIQKILLATNSCGKYFTLLSLYNLLEK